MKDNKIKVAFAGINQKVEEHIPQNVSLDVNKDFIAWGKDNKYPNFLYDLYANSSTLSSIINGVTDFVVGDAINYEEYEELLYNVVKDYLIYGVAYINVLCNHNHEITRLHYINAKNIRSNEDNTVFFYSEDWSKSYGRVKTIVLPKYSTNCTYDSCILMIKNYGTDTYTSPIYSSAIKSIVTDIEINKFHLNEIFNNFSASAIINFNNGTPTDEDKDEIENMINEKFCGAENSGRFVLVFNDNKESSTTIERLNTDDFEKRYDVLYKKVRQDIFTAFRANPNLFGIPTENLGFSNEEYETSFRLFNRTVIKPIQKKIVNEFNKLGFNLEIKPFSLDDNNKEEIVE